MPVTLRSASEDPILVDGDGRTSQRVAHPVRRRLVGEASVVFVVALALAVATTWPLTAHASTMAANATDAPFQAWTIEHDQWALSTGAPLFDANIFAPNRHTLAYSDNLLGLAVPLFPLRWLGVSPVGRLNVALLVGMALSAAAAYLFGRVVSSRRVVGVFTAVAFVFGPFASGSTSHLHAAVKPGIALAATAAWWLADRSRSGGRLLGPAGLLAVTVAWQTSVSFYPGAYSLGAALLVFVVRNRDLRWRGAKAAGVALATAVGAMVVLAVPNMAVLAEGRDFVKARSEVAGLGVNFAAAQQTSVWGSALGSRLFSAPAFPGVTLLALTLVGLVHGLRSTDRARRTVATGAAFVALGAFLGLGTAPTGWRTLSPYGLLFDHVPGFSVLRVAFRAWSIGLLGVGLVAGTGAAVVLGAVRRWRPGPAAATVGMVLVVAVLVEGQISWSDRPRIEVSEVDRVLAADPRPGGVAYLPMLSNGDANQSLATTYGQVENVYGTTAHHRLTPNGYSGLAPVEWPRLSARMRSVPSPATIRELRRIGVRFVVVRATAVGTPWGRLLDPSQAGPLRLTGRYDGDLLYELPGDPGP